MLHDLPSYQQLCARELSISDLTLVVAVRAFEGNPWVKERLRKLAGYYQPAPHVIVVDFGSQEPHRAELERICQEGDFQYLFEGDEGVFSLARARNLGAAAATTDLLFFSDVDCFGERDLCARLVRQANVIELGSYFDQMINLPVYHLSEQTTAAVLGRADPEEASLLIARAMARAAYSAQGSDADYVDSASNFFVCHRRFFDLVGGYNENFRGHGSEDYEFHLRFAILAKQFPLPKNPMKNIYRPQKGEFFRQKTYQGFRRLGELMAFQSEIAGLRLAHLLHGRPREEGSWYLENDWRRERFSQQVEPFLKDASILVDYDWLPRSKRLLVLLKHRWQYEFFLPLRLAGHGLELVRDDAAARERAAELIEKRAVGGVAIFNPYMKSHASFRPLFEQARRAGLETVVVERGALPESWYYGRDVSYNDESWNASTITAAELNQTELAVARDYLEQLRRGEAALEEQGGFADTLSRHRDARSSYDRALLIPLQISDDMAVTQYTDGYPAYQEFLSELQAVVRERSDILFFIKPHPLTKQIERIDAPNVVWCGCEDNIHALIEQSDAVVCYNSGVGLLSILHGKPTVTLGNAYYNLAGLGQRAKTVVEALRMVRNASAGEGSGPADRVRFLAWLLFRKYSFFKARSHMRDFGQRRSHEYRDLRFYQASVAGYCCSVLRTAEELQYTPTSYAAGRLVLEAENRSVTGVLADPTRRLRKLVRNPKKFFQESNYRALRWVGRRF